MKTLRPLLALLLVLMLLSACGSATGATPQAGQPSASAPPQGSAATGIMNPEGLPIVKEPYTLKLMGYQHDTVYKDLNELGIVKEWEAQTGIKFEFEVVNPADKVERVNLAIATNNLPDVFYGNIATDLVKNGSEGTYLALEELIEKWCPNITALFNERPEIKNTATAPDGHIYGFPKFYETGQHNCYGFYIHMDWLEDTGLGMPQTTDELLTVLRAMKGKDLNGNGIADEYPLGFTSKDSLFNYGNFYTWFGMPAYNIVYVGEDGKVGSGFTHPGYKAGLDFVHTLYSEGLCDPEVYTQDVQAYRAKVKEYKYGSFFMFAPYNSFGTEMNKEDYRYELVPAPKAPDGNTGWVWNPTTPETNAMVITKACRNPEIAARFADYCAETEMSLQLGEGLLGQNLLSNGDGTYHMANPMGEGETFAGFSFHILTRDRLKLVEPGFLATQRVPRTELYEPIVNKDTIYPSIMSTAEEAEQIAVLQTEIMNFINQKQAEWVVNGDLEEGWDAYVKQLEAMKLNDLIAIYQTMYDRYLANK